MRRSFALAFSLFVIGTVCAAKAQLSMTGVGGGGFGASSGSTVTVNGTPGTETYQANGASLNYTGLTIAAGTNTALLCALLRADGANDVAAGVALTWDTAGGSPTNQPLTYSSTLTRFANAELAGVWGLRSPTPGNKTLHIAWTNAGADNFVACMAFDHVLQTNDGAAFPNTATAVAGSVAVTSATGDMVIGAINNQPNGSLLLGTTIFNDTVSGSLVNAAADYDVGAASVTIGTVSGSGAIAVGVDVAHD